MVLIYRQEDAGVESRGDRELRFRIGQGDFFSGKHSVGGNPLIPKSNAYYRVRRTWKAAPAFNKREHAVFLPNEVYAGSKSQ
jgi:hypothetical protein